MTHRAWPAEPVVPFVPVVPAPAPAIAWLVPVTSSAGLALRSSATAIVVTVFAQ